MSWPRTPKLFFGRLSVCAACALSLWVLAGCGLGAGDPKGNVELTVTRDFGVEKIAEYKKVPIKDGDTVLRAMERRLDVETAYGGGFINSIEGLKSDYTGSRRSRRDWFFYINGIESSSGAKEVKVDAGDAIWWDYRDWSTVQRISAVVGAYPHPFIDGGSGEMNAVRLDCATDSDRICSDVELRLDRLGLKFKRSQLGTRQDKKGVRIVVGTWSQIEEDPEARRLSRQPGSSGVFARFARVGNSGRLSLYSADGEIAVEVGDGAGLVAATKSGGDMPTWIIAGTDNRGLERAVGLFNEKSLQNRFAVAVTDKGTIALPVVKETRS